MLDITGGDLEAAKRVKGKLEALLEAMGAHKHRLERRLYLGKNIPSDTADANFFPTIGAVNPTLTMIANASRVADHIAGQLEGGSKASSGSTQFLKEVFHADTRRNFRRRP